MHPWTGAFPRWLTGTCAALTLRQDRLHEPGGTSSGWRGSPTWASPTRASGSWNGWSGGRRRRSSSSPGSRCDTSGPRSGGTCGSCPGPRTCVAWWLESSRSPARGLDRASRPPQAHPTPHPGRPGSVGGLVRGEHPAQASSTAGPGTAGAGSRCSARARARLRRGGGVGRADRTVALVVTEEGPRRAFGTLDGPAALRWRGEA